MTMATLWRRTWDASEHKQRHTHTSTSTRTHARTHTSAGNTRTHAHTHNTARSEAVCAMAMGGRLDQRDDPVTPAGLL